MLIQSNWYKLNRHELTGKLILDYLSIYFVNPSFFSYIRIIFEMLLTRNMAKGTKYVILFFILSFSLECFSQGLKFSGMETTIEQRTSLDVFGGKKPPVFENELRIDFLLCNYPISNFGYILRIKDADNPSLTWNLSFNARGEDVMFRLNEEGRYSLIKAAIPTEQYGDMSWTPVSIVFSLERKTVSLTIGGLSFTGSSEMIPDSIRPIIMFGRSDYIIDVPSFAIRELTVSSDKRSLQFLFEESSGDIAHEKYGHMNAKVVNPTWLINEAEKWKNIAEAEINGYAGSAYNPARREIYLFNSEEIIITDIISGQITRHAFANECPLHIDIGGCFTDRSGDRLTAYELFTDSDVTTAWLDLDGLEWHQAGNDRIDMPLHHHSSFINMATGEYTIFGGFGNSLYSGNYYSLGSDGHWRRIWDEPQEERVAPRYFSSAGTDYESGEIYIFGGMGNESGDQVVGRQYYYDLHRIEPQTGKSTLIWKLDWPENDIVPVRHLFVNDGNIYTVCYSEYNSDSELFLYSFSLKDGSWKIYADGIPINSDSIHTNADIFYDESMQKIFCLVFESRKNEMSRFRVYSLSFPPAGKQEESDSLSKYMALACLLLAAGTLLVLISRFRRHPDNGYADELEISVPSNRPNSILLFGDFYASNRDGRDISYMFTSQLRLIFLLILSKSPYGGISSRRIAKTVWPDKDDIKMKNSRGVALHHLRNILEEFDGISLKYHDDNYVIETGDEFFCDWMSVLGHINGKTGDASTVLNLLARGGFLQYYDEPLLDYFKSETENLTLHFLHGELRKTWNDKRYKDVTTIAGIIRKIDPLDETALEYEIKALKKMRRTDEANIRYAEYMAEYKRVNGTEKG